MHRKRLLVLGACVAALGAVAAAATALSTGGASSLPGFVPVQYSYGIGPSGQAVGITGRSLDTTLRQLLARINDPLLGDADVWSLPATSGSPGGETVTMTATLNGPGTATMKAIWEGELVAGALRDVAAENNLDSLDNFQINVRRPDDTVVPTDSGFGNVVREQVFEKSSAGELEQRIRAGLKSVGLNPIAITFVPALQLAPVVIAAADDPSAIVVASTEASFWTQMLGDFDNYEGYYLELQDSGGQPFLISTAAHRAGVSSGWIRPDLQPHRVTSPNWVEPNK